MDSACQFESMDSDPVQLQDDDNDDNNNDMVEQDFCSDAFQERIEGILKFARLTTGEDVFFASHACNSLGLAPSSIVFSEFGIEQRLFKSGKKKD